MDRTGAIEAATEATAGNRGRPRDSIFLQAVLRPDNAETASAAFTVRVRNISPEGMMGESETGVTARERIQVELRNIGRIQGTIAWVNGQRFGIAFDTPIDPKLVRERPKIAPEPIVSRNGFRRIEHPLG